MRIDKCNFTHCWNISISLTNESTYLEPVVADFVETMKLVEKAQEDIYFAKLDRELIEEMHRRAAAAKAVAVTDVVAKGVAKNPHA